MRVVVVGGGVIGLLTAIQCARAGALVDLVDQADIPAPLATSNDRIRIVRALHRGDAPLTQAAARAQQGWAEVERMLDTPFYHRVGSLTAMPQPDVAGNLALLAAAGADARVLSPEQLAARYPQIRFPHGWSAVLESVAGAVLADRALSAMADWLGEQPTVWVHPRRRVVGIDERGAVRFADSTTLAADGVVIAAGPWSRDLLADALRDDLTLYRQSLLSYLPSRSRQAWAATPAIPVLGTATGAWLMPPVADAPARLSAASACRPVAAMTDRVTSQHWREHLVEEFRAVLVDFDPASVIGAQDGYYLAATGTGGPLLARLGDLAVWAYAACGGMSFKFAPLIADVLADRALGRPPRLTGVDAIDRPRELASRGISL